MQEENKTLKQIFEENKVDPIEGFSIGFRTYPFKGIYIKPEKDCMLLTFSLYGKYLCGMTYTSFATNYLFSRRFYETDTMETVINWIREIYKEISDSIESTNLKNKDVI